MDIPVRTYGRYVSCVHTLLKTQGTVFPNTDRPRAVHNTFMFFNFFFSFSVS